MQNWFVLLAMFIPLISCSKKGADHAEVTIVFPRQSLSDNQDSLAKASTSSADSDSPDWGLADPSSLTDIGCWGVFVGGPETEMQTSACENDNGNTIMRFGPRAGFFTLDQPGRVQVPVGDNRRFWLVGMASSDGTCQPGFSTNTELDFPNYSAPFVLGQATQTIDSDNQTVFVELQNQFSEANRLGKCQFFSPTQNRPNPELKVSLVQTLRRLWITNNPQPRTVTFTHTMGTPRCRVGLNPIDCSGGQFVWRWTDRDKVHRIDILDEDGRRLDTFSFVPDLEYPGLGHDTCTLTINDGATLSSLASPLAGGNQVICFASGATIAGNTAPLSITSGSTLLTPIGEAPATVLNNNSTAGTFIINNQSQVNLYGLNIQALGGSGYPALRVVNGVQINLVDVTVNNPAGGHALEVYSTLASTSHVRISNGMLSASSSSGYGLHVHASDLSLPATVQVRDSRIEGEGMGLYATVAANLSVDGSELVGIGTTSFPFQLREKVTMNLTNSTVYDPSGYGGNLHCNFRTNPDLIPRLTLEGNTFKREDSSSGVAGTPALQTSDCSTPPFLFSNNNDNWFCNVNAAGLNYSMIADPASFAGTSTFDVNLNNGGLGNTNIPECP
jgi:hypothetical protein